MPIKKVFSIQYLVFSNLYKRVKRVKTPLGWYEVTPRRWKDYRGFTLMELVIVMAILAILSTGGVATYIRSLKRGRDAQRKSDLAQVQKALEAYYNDKGGYPAASSHQIAACGGGGTGCVWGADGLEDVAVAPAVRTVYMKLLPKDPVVGQNYLYVSDGLSYKVYAKLENDDDLQAVGTYTVNCGSATCNYGVSSSNTSP